MHLTGRRAGGACRYNILEMEERALPCDPTYPGLPSILGFVYLYELLYIEHQIMLDRLEYGHIYDQC